MKKTQKQEETKMEIQNMMKNLPDEVKIAIEVMRQTEVAQKNTPSQDIECAPINFSF